MDSCNSSGKIYSIIFSIDYFKELQLVVVTEGIVNSCFNRFDERMKDARVIIGIVISGANQEITLVRMWCRKFGEHVYGR